MQYSINSAKELAKKVAENTSLDITSGCCLMALEVQGSCGQATLSSATMLFDGEQIKSNQISGTTLRWFPKEQLRFVNRIYQSAQRELSSYGVSFGKGLTMVPLSILPVLTQKLNELQDEFDTCVQELVDNYDFYLDAHKNNNPEVSKHIERVALSVHEFRGRFSFNIVPPMAVNPLFDEDKQAVEENVKETLWEEIADAAKRLYQTSFVGKDRVSQKAVSAVKKIKRKLIDLSFLDDSIINVADAYDVGLSGLPTSGYLESGDFFKLSHFISQVSDVSYIKALAGGVSDTAEDVFNTESVMSEDLALTENHEDVVPVSDVQQLVDTLSTSTSCDNTVVETQPVNESAVEEIDAFDGFLNF